MDTSGKQARKHDAGKEIEHKASGNFGFFFDQTRCDGCYACVIACKDWHHIPAGPAKWLRISTIEKGKYPNPFMAFKINFCNHCLQAPCLLACPANAINKRERDGIVVVDGEKCLGRDECGHPCSYECPAGNDVAGFVSLIKEGKHPEAWARLIENNPLPGVCGRICYHPCESGCNRGQVDQELAIHALERFAADYAHKVLPCTLDRRKERIAVVGSGPAGLSCAYHLTKRGYNVTVFEARPVVGGMLRMGIPEYRLPKAILDREIAFIQSMGVDTKTNMELGKNLKLEDLDNFDAVFLSIGAQKEKTPKLPGIELQGVTTGLDFLRKAKLGENMDVGRSVVVLGGGNVAFDCARTARRMGAATTHIICPECSEDMLADPSEIEQGAEEGIAIHTSCTLSSIQGENGCVAGAQLIKLRSMNFDKEGKLHFEFIEGSEQVLPAELVIIAIGQGPDLSVLPEDIKVDRGIICIDEDGVTSRRKYFAGGDAAGSPPQRRVAWSIGSGRRAAQAIDRMLQGLPEEKPRLKPAESKLIDTDFIEKKERVRTTTLPAHERHRGFAEVELGLDIKQAKAEAERCLTCQGMCFVACPYGAPQFGAEDNPKMQKCDFCLEEWEKGKQPMCVRSCTMRALDAGPMEELRAKYGNVREAEGFSYYEKSEPTIIFKPKVYRKPES